MNQRNISAFEFGRFVAKTAQAKVAQDLDNELSPDAISPENMALAKKMLSEKNPGMGRQRPVMVQMPPRPAAPATPVMPYTPKNRAPLRPTPSALTAEVINKQPPRDHAADYDAWRLSQGLSPGGPKGTNPPIPLQQLGGGEAPVKMPPNVR